MVSVVQHISFGGADRGVVRHLDGRAVRTTVSIPLHRIVAEEANAVLFLCVKDGTEERLDRVFRIVTDRLCEEVCRRLCVACCTRRLFLLCERWFRLRIAVRTELEVDAETVDSCLLCAVIITMVEDVVDANIRHCILAELLLQHEVPDAECLALVTLCACHSILVLEDVPTLHVTVHRHVVCVACDRVAVEHVNVVVSPQGCTETARGILVVNADINLVLRLVEKLARHVRVTFVDRLEIGVAELA